MLKEKKTELCLITMGKWRFILASFYKVFYNFLFQRPKSKALVLLLYAKTFLSSKTNWQNPFPKFLKPQKVKTLSFATDTFAPVDLLPWVLLAAEDEGRTEEPSERKIQREREKGRVAKSAEIPSSLVTVGLLLVLFVLSGWFLTGLAEIMTLYLGGFNSLPALQNGGLMSLMVSVSKEMAWILMPVFLTALLLGFAGNVVQVGFLFSLKPIAFDFSRISLTWDKLMKRVLFSRQVVVNLLKSLAKFVFLGAIAYFLIASDLGTLLKTTSMSVPETLKLLAFLSFKLALILSVLLLLIAIPDYFYQRYEYMESLKMTVQEVKEEFKEQEGDPMIKGEQKRRMQEMMTRNVSAQVKTASVVITNPIHYAVALAYENSKHSAPVVVAKGVDSVAIYIRTLARREEIPVVENRPVARGLFEACDVGQEIPVEFYTIVSQILVPIYNKKRRSYAS